MQVLQVSPRHLIAVLAFSLLAFSFSALPVFAQIIDQQKISDTAGNFTEPIENDDLFGWSVINLGDLDGDGVTDLATGVPGDDDGGDGAGCIYILFMNTDGTVKSHQKISATQGGFTGVLEAGDSFGHSLALIGDYDGDGINDIAAGSLFDDDGGLDRGAFWLLFLNADGTVKSHQKVSQTEGGFTDTLTDSDGFGHGIVRIGDLDGDGVDDLASATGHIAHEGIIWILLMKTDFTVKSYHRITEGEGGFTGVLDLEDELGHDMDALGDFDGDGVPDIIAGSPHDDDGGTDRGAAFVLFLNADGTVKSHQKISDTEGGFTGVLDDIDDFGHPPANAGDLDGDGISDVLMGAPFDDDGGLDIGGFWILFMNADGTVKGHQKISKTQGGFVGDIETDDLFSHIVTSIGDLDGDGGTDFAVATPHDDDGGGNRGAIWILFSNYGTGGNIAPTASFTFSTNLLTADFTDTSTDTDGSVVSWDWDFGDTNSSSAQNPSHTYATSGTYSVTLTVTDDIGAMGSTQQSVTVNDGGGGGTMHIEAITTVTVRTGGGGMVDATIVVADENGSPVETATVSGTFSGDLAGTDSGVTNENGEVVLTSDEFSARPFDLGICVDNVTHGTFVYDPAANTDPSFACDTGGNVSPTAAFTFTTSLLTANFTDNSVDTDGTLVSWDWAFGDTNTSNSQNPSHTYAANGTFTVSLTVTDDMGATGSTSQTVTVNDGTGGETMSIASITTPVVVRSGGTGNAQATVTVVDVNGAPVADATVFGVYSGDTSGSPSSVTNGDGEVVLLSDEITSRPQTIEFCVENVTHATLTYDPAANGDPSYACATAGPSSAPGGRDVLSTMQENPVDFVLLQNYPNPFNPTTMISFGLPEAGHVSVRVYNLLGQEVATVVNEVRDAGQHHVLFDASALSAGVYLYIMELPKVTITKHMTLLK